MSWLSISQSLDDLVIPFSDEEYLLSPLNDRSLSILSMDHGSEATSVFLLKGVRAPGIPVHVRLIPLIGMNLTTGPVQMARIVEKLRRDSRYQSSLANVGRYIRVGMITNGAEAVEDLINRGVDMSPSQQREMGRKTGGYVTLEMERVETTLHSLKQVTPGGSQNTLIRDDASRTLAIRSILLQTLVQLAYLRTIFPGITLGNLSPRTIALTKERQATMGGIIYAFGADKNEELVVPWRWSAGYRVVLYAMETIIDGAENVALDVDLVALINVDPWVRAALDISTERPGYMSGEVIVELLASLDNKTLDGWRRRAAISQMAL